ncbi:J-domain-containing protein [Microbacterium sp. H83]|uniref:DnaJ family domain-containing protein n=1 Tax=Microbacterium sp. H83 TaxID=1827324 RepID=UPI0007F38C4B|nr:DUF1992 domain-containing protein [Microbacterium sp. H83]OAN33059.1 molecular chaperone DnaJ [Microbacterium sp. H83]
MSDPREAAARYRARRQGDLPDEASDADAGSPPGAAAAVDRAAYIETAIQIAMRRGDFDDLPGAGKPIPGLGTHHDPDWWIRRKIQTENLTGLGPPAIMLRAEDRALDERLDHLRHEAEVREALEDFNRRVVEARRQLQGGPPVVTALREVDVEIEAWAARRAARAAEPSAAAEAPAPGRRRRFGIRRRS